MSNRTENTGKILVQSRFVPTTAASIYTVPTGSTTEVQTIVVCNTTASNAEIYIFIDEDGTTYDESTALFWQTDITLDSTTIFDTTLWLPQGANLAVNVETTIAITFTFFGFEHKRGIKPTFLQGPALGQDQGAR